jgi:hypothetical protein
MRAEARARLLAAIAKARFLARQADPRRFTSTAEIALTSAAANARRCATRGNPAGRGTGPAQCESVPSCRSGAFVRGGSGQARNDVERL